MIENFKEVIEKLSERGFACPKCEAEFEEEDFAYLQESGQCQYCHREIDFYDYSDTPFQNKCKEVTREISETFKGLGFTDTYLIHLREQYITKEDVEKYIYSKLVEMDEYRKHDFNEMWSMLSSTNCWHVDYEIGQIVHEQLMSIWYPEDSL